MNLKKWVGHWGATYLEIWPVLVRTWAAKVKRGLVLVSKAMHISSFVSVACQAKHPPAAAACSFPAFGLKQLIHAWCGAGISSETPVDEQDPVGHAAEEIQFQQIICVCSWAELRREEEPHFRRFVASRRSSCTSKKRKAAVQFSRKFDGVPFRLSSSLHSYMKALDGRRRGCGK